MYVRVRVQPGAKKESVTKHSDTEFVIMVREPAERNLANKRVTELVAEAFGVEKNKVRILTGHRSKVKMLTIDI